MEYGKIVAAFTLRDCIVIRGVFAMPNRLVQGKRDIFGGVKMERMER